MFVDALRSEEDMRRFCSATPAHVPKLANMLVRAPAPERARARWRARMPARAAALVLTRAAAVRPQEGGATPICTPAQLQDMGFKIVAYPLSLLGVSIAAMESALISLRTGVLPGPAALPSFAHIQEVVGFNAYYEEEAKYKA